MKPSSEILHNIIQIQIKKINVQKAKEKLLYDHRMKMNRVKSLEDILWMDREIAFRELQYALKKEEVQKVRVNFEDLFPESGSLDLTGYDFLE